MSFLSERILRLTKRLYSTGRAFRVPEGGVLEQLHITLNKSEEAAYSDAIGILDTILPDNDNFTEEDALDWEERLGIVIRPDVPLEDRKAAILRKMNHPGDKLERAHYLFIQKQLQLAGFKVWVYENRFPLSGGFITKSLARFVEQHYNPQFTGQFQHGQIQHGQSQLFNAFEKVVNFLSNEEDENVDVVNGRQTFFIGGDEPGKWANVLPSRETEFRKTILQLKPVESAALLAIKYGDGLFDDPSTLTTPAFGNTRLRALGNRLYTLNNPRTAVQVWNIDADAAISGETVSGLVDGRGFDIDEQADKIYIVDEDGGTDPRVRVFNQQTNAEIPGENFGSGTLTINSGNPIFYKGEIYIYDNFGGVNDKIFVFNVGTGALDRTIPILENYSWHEVADDTLIITYTGTEQSMRFYDLQGNENVDLRQTSAEGINAPRELTVENGFLYLCNAFENRIRRYEFFRGKLELIDSFAASGCFRITVSDDNLVWTEGSNWFLRKRNT